ncbi:MAG: YfgM family protein [bacterium]
MDAYVTDEERVEQIKKWWSENGNYLIAGIALGLSILVGWNYWQKYQVEHAGEASTLYSSIETQVAAGTTKDNGAAAQLSGDYADTPYALLARLQLAKNYVAQGKLPLAESSLREVVAEGEALMIVDLARARLARVLLADGKADEAIKVLDGITNNAFVSLREEARGDALVSKGDIANAREAYEKAILTAGGRADFLQLKKDDLGSE